MTFLSLASININLRLISPPVYRSIIFSGDLCDSIVLGATDDAVITWMKNPTNSKVLELIKRDTYPDMYLEESASKK